MPLTENQQKILQSIDDISKSNKTSCVLSDAVATNLGIEPYRVENQFDYLAEQGFIKTLMKQSHLDNVSVYMVELTSKGKVALSNPDELNHPNPLVQTIQQDFKYSTIGSIQNGDYNQASVTQNINQSLVEVLESIKELYKIVEPLPEEKREEVTVHLDDLKEEVELPHRRDPKKIRAYLKVLLAVGAGLVVGAVQFTDGVMDIAQKLGVPIHLPHTSEYVNKFPPSP